MRSSVRIYYLSNPLFKGQSNSPRYERIRSFPQIYRYSPADMILRTHAESYRKEIPITSAELTDKIAKVLPHDSISLGISTEFPFSE